MNFVRLMLFAVIAVNIILTGFQNFSGANVDNPAEQALLSQDGSLVQVSIFLAYSKIENSIISQVNSLSPFYKLLNKNSNLVYKLINTAGIKNFTGCVKFRIFITSHFSTST